MNGAPSSDVRDAAARWVVRLQADSVTDDDLMAFDAWLTAASDHQRAYDAALETWLQFDGRTARSIGAGLERRAAGRRAAARRWTTGALVAGALAASVVLVARPLFPTPSAPVVYATKRGEQRSVMLADGTRVALNTATRVSVQFDRGTRRVTLHDGEAAFAVTHDADRPFVVATAAGELRDVGTEFDVRHRQGILSVTVSQGAVDFTPAGTQSAAPLRLTRGDRLVHGHGVANLHKVTPEDDFSWRDRRLVLRQEPLGAVVDELNLYFDRPIRIATPALARQMVSGVLSVDEEDATLRRLTLFTPIKVASQGGGVVLQSAGETAATP